MYNPKDHLKQHRNSIENPKVPGASISISILKVCEKILNFGRPGRTISAMFSPM
jgi:hypothetical protein